MNKNNINCWVVTEDLAGTRNQCLGVAEAMNIEPVVKTIALKAPWKILSPYLGFEQPFTFTPEFDAPWPDLLITSGRKSIAAARYIKKQSPKTFCAHIQDPRFAADKFDLIAVPEHDPTRGKNVITTNAAANRITPEKLAAAKEQFPQFEQIKQPRVAVLIGGNSKAHKLTPGVVQTLCEQLKTIDAGLMITTSRRTGKDNEATLRESLKDTDSFIWDGQSNNPYLGMLGWADYILVTSDSVSMLSEACTTGKPVYMIPMEGGSKRLDKLHTNLQQSKALRIFQGHLEHWTYSPLNDAQKIADEIKKRLRDFK